MKFTDFAGGGQAWYPGSTFYPETSYMAQSGFTHAANVHMCAGIIKSDPFLTAAKTYRTVFRSQHSGQTIGSLNLQPSDAATAPNGGQMFGRDSGGGVAFDIRCSDVLVDGEKHWFFFSINTATGDYIFIVDGQPATIAYEAVNLSTQASGASAAIGVGSNDAGTAAVNWEGELSYFLYDDKYLPTYQDFFDNFGNPKELDTTGWTEFAAGQPLICARNGDPRGNLGSLTSWTVTGTDIRSGAMMDYPPNRGIATIGDATRGDLPDGKVAWVDAQRIVGTQRNEGIIAAMDFRGSALALEAYDGSTCGMLYPGVTVGTMGGGLERSPEGAKMYVPGSGIWFNGVPAFTNGRHIILTLDLDWNGFGSGLIDVNTNFQDGANTYFCRIIWSASGYWILQIYSAIGGVTTQRASLNLLSTIEDCYGVFTVTDIGDTLMATATLIEKATTTVLDSQDVSYYAAARPLKASNNFRIDLEQTQAIKIQTLLAVNF